MKIQGVWSLASVLVRAAVGWPFAVLVLSCAVKRECVCVCVCDSGAATRRDRIHGMRERGSRTPPPPVTKLEIMTAQLQPPLCIRRRRYPEANHRPLVALAKVGPARQAPSFSRTSGMPNSSLHKGAASPCLPAVLHLTSYSTVTPDQVPSFVLVPL